METQHCHLTMLKSFTLNDATSPDEAIFQRMKQWMQSLIRTSTLISRSGEKDRIVFFEEQRRIVDMRLVLQGAKRVENAPFNC